eukprot:TRINITY_DN314_c0_g2_i9.p1 TRINITY_DN314_c0_g2~~TRINITY_DN314_c0_g2_i9.p1  ORF type:complete len:293 (+),score=60.26 TRINITY_DN314_c0_g2_i9:328-1206(+)
MRPVSYVKCPCCQADLTKKGTKRRRCAGCHSIFYDELSCQKKDWLIHKSECKAQKRRLIAVAQLTHPDVDNMTKLLDCPEVCKKIAESYQEGFGGFEKNRDLSIFWVQKWAKGGDPEAEAMLATILMDGGRGPSKQAAGERRLRRAAENGSAIAQFNMGVSYNEGTFGAIDDEEAVKWYRKSAEQGNAEAQVNLANRLRDGRGVAKDEVEAVKWFRKAAEQGHVKAQYSLVGHLLDGCGVAKDEVEAVKWCRKSARRARLRTRTVLSRLLPEPRLWCGEGRTCGGGVVPEVG